MFSPTHKWKWSPLWTGIAWLLVAIIAYLSLVPDPPLPMSSNADVFGHVIGYAAVTFWFMQIYGTAPARAVIAAGLLLFGILLEFAQGYSGYRDFETADMIANAVGIMAGWLAAPPRTANLLERIENAV